MTDTVNHPDHYNAHPSGIECIDIVEHMTFNLGNAVKYIWRADHKDNALEDLRKAAWYIQREIERQSKADTGRQIPPPLTDLAKWRRYCRIQGMDQETPMPPGWCP